MHRLRALAWKELILLSRDWHGLLVSFVVPALFILIMSLALRDAFFSERTVPLSWEIHNEDGAPLAADLEARLRGLPGFSAAETDDPQIRITLLPGFSELLATRFDFASEYQSGLAEPMLLRIEYAPTLLPQARALSEMAVRQVLQAVQSDYLLETVLGYPKEKSATLRYVSDPRQLPLEQAMLGGAKAIQPSAVQQSVPGWLIFALFFSVIPLATHFVIERMEGSLLRLRALDVSPVLLIASKALPYYGVNLLQAAAMLAIGVWLVPALGGDALRLPNEPLALWLIVSATSLAALGMALLVAVLVRTTTQATLAGGAISLIFAAVGGIMVPKLIMPPTMQAATQLSPMSWALEAFWDVLLRGGGVTAVLPEAGALALFGLLALGAAALLLRRDYQ